MAAFTGYREKQLAGILQARCKNSPRAPLSSPKRSSWTTRPDRYSHLRRCQRCTEMNILLQECTAGCPAQPQPHRMKQRFVQADSHIEITVWNIPALVCPICRRSFLEEEIAQRLSLLCLPFHGTPGSAPDLPPAKVTIDFARAAESITVSSGKAVMVYEDDRHS